MATPRDLVFLIFDGIQSLDLTGPFEVFAGANTVLADDAPGRYRLTVISADGGLVTTESGLEINSVPADRAPRRFDSLIVPGGLGAQRASGDEQTIASVQDLARRADRVLTICSGVFLAAAAGLADGHRVTTHWSRADQLAANYPTIDVDVDAVFVHDRELWTSAGVTAGIDLALAVVEHDHDAEIAQIIARWLVMFLRRPGGQSQFATPVWTDRAEFRPIRAAQDLIDAEPNGDHRVGVLAQQVGMSERHFTRCFADEVGTSPARYVVAVRVDAARRELEITTDTVDAIARRCGFGSGETMRRAFSRRIGVSPDQYRQRFRIPPTSTTPPAERSLA